MSKHSKWIHLWYAPRGAVSACLRPVAMVFGWVVWLRRLLFRMKLLPSETMDVPVIVVGNITAGGTGKTPIVGEIARRLSERGWSPGIISRGYGGSSESWPQMVTPDSNPNEVGDEPLLLAQSLSIPVAVAPRRVEAARAAIFKGGANILVSDDGLSHYALNRTLEVAIIDAARGLGNELLLPAGPLREPASRLDAVDLVLQHGGGASQPSFVLVPTELRSLDGEGASLTTLQGLRVDAIAGIGNPRRFFESLTALGAEVIEHAFDDHHRFEQSDFTSFGMNPIVMTEKDAIKCRRLSLPTKAYALQVDVEVSPVADKALTRMLDQLGPPPRAD
jgi:tetraacyldisaccharide 4'-kinase